MFLSIYFVLLLFALGSSAHSLSRIKIINGSDIYEIRAKPNNMFEIIEPKIQVPTLREIIYFKIKEMPYKNHLEKEKLSQEKEPDFDDSERPYTNGPGFQFLDFEPMEENQSMEDDKNYNESNNDSDDSGDSDYDSNESSLDSPESYIDSGDSDSDSNESSPDSHETNNDNNGSQIDSKESNNDNSDDDISKNNSKESNNGNSDDDVSKNNSKENNNGNSDDDVSKNNSKENNNGNSDDDISKNNSKESDNGNSDDDISKNNSKESDNGNSDDDISKNNSKESNNGNSDDDISKNNSKESNNGNSDDDISKNNSKESNNGNSDDDISKNNSKENNNGNSDDDISKTNSKESNNGNSDDDISKNNSKESNNGNSDDDISKNNSKKSNNGNSDDDISKNNSKESNNGNSGSNESKNEGHENQIDSNKGEADNNSESTADSDKLKEGSSDADKKDVDHDKDNENKENDSKDTSKTLNGQKDKNKNINDNITPDVYQSTESTAAVNKIEADNSPKLERRKRNIDYGMPPPPVLQPLNVRMLPDFIQRMISNIPALKNVMSPDERGPNYLDDNSPQNYGFHLNDRVPVWNNLPFINQDDPSNMINSEKQDEYQENNEPDSSNDVGNSGSDDNSLYSDNDSEYNAEPDEETDRNSDDNSISGTWPNMGAPIIDFNNFKPYNPIIKENNLNNIVNKINKDADIIEQHEPTIQHTTENNVNYHQQEKNKKSTAKEPKKVPTYTPAPKTKININKELKEKIEMSFDNIGKIVPSMLTRFEENLVKTAVHNNEAPLTFGMKLSGDNGYDLADPGNHYLFGETLETNKEWNEPSSSNNDVGTNEPTEPHEDKGTTPIVTANSIENQSQKPSTGSEDLNEPNKESIDKDKNKSEDKKDNEPVQLALDDLLKKDEFWQWLTKWTAAYISVLNEHVEELVKKEVAKQLNKTMSQKNEKEKDKIDTNNNDLINKNETIANGTIANGTIAKGAIANVTTVEPANNRTEINSNITTTEKSIPEVNNTENIAQKKDKININKILSNGHKSNKTTPGNPHTIYGNAIDSDHVTNIFIFYPNAENNATAKDIEAILGNKNNNIVVLGKPTNDNKESQTPDSSMNSPIDETTGIYAIDPKKDLVSNASETISQAPGTKNNQSSTADIPTTANNENTTATIKANPSNSTDASTSNVANATTVDNATSVANATTVDNATSVANATSVDNATPVANAPSVHKATSVANATSVDNGATVAVSPDATQSTSANNTKATDTAAGTKVVPAPSTASK